MQILRISKVRKYGKGFIRYSLHKSHINNSSIALPEGLKFWKTLPVDLGYIGYSLSGELNPALSLDTVHPLSEEPLARGTGLGSFILSNTFINIYNDSFSSKDINPKTRIIVNTSAKNLVRILENRSFKKEVPGYISTIQEAATDSIKILKSRYHI